MTAPSWTPEADEPVIFINDATGTQNIATVTGVIEHGAGGPSAIVCGMAFRPSETGMAWRAGNLAILPTTTPGCEGLVARWHVTAAAELLNLEAIRLLNRAHNGAPIDLAPATAALDALRAAATTLTALETR